MKNIFEVLDSITEEKVTVIATEIQKNYDIEFDEFDINFAITSAYIDARRAAHDGNDPWEVCRITLEKKFKKSYEDSIKWSRKMKSSEIIDVSEDVIFAHKQATDTHQQLMNTIAQHDAMRMHQQAVETHQRMVDDFNTTNFVNQQIMLNNQMMGF